MVKEKTNLYLLSIVGIVAIVGIVVLVLNSGAGSVSLSTEDLSGEAVGSKKLVKMSDCKSGEVMTPTGECVSVFAGRIETPKTGSSASAKECNEKTCDYSTHYCYNGECAPISKN